MRCFLMVPSFDWSLIQRIITGMYHNLTCGETDDNVDIVFNDAISWVEKRI